MIDAFIYDFFHVYILHLIHKIHISITEYVIKSPSLNYIKKWWQFYITEHMKKKIIKD